MISKRILLFLLTAILFSACSLESTGGLAGSDRKTEKETSGDTGIVWERSDDGKFHYPFEGEFKEWHALTADEQALYHRVPDNVFAECSDEELVELALEYPGLFELNWDSKGVAQALKNLAAQDNLFACVLEEGRLTHYAKAHQNADGTFTLSPAADPAAEIILAAWLRYAG